MKKNTGRKRSSVYSVGVNDSKTIVRKNGALIKSYAAWGDMLKRCYNEKFLQKHDTYKGCQVCEEWLLFSNFEKWYNNNYIEGYELDKDILIKGNKLYSPDTCCFVPHEINSLLVKANRIRGKYPVGVHKNTYRERYKAECATKTIGTYATPEEAFVAYKEYKESLIKRIASEYYKENNISKNVFEALCNYQVEITD